MIEVRQAQNQAAFRQWESDRMLGVQCGVSESTAHSLFHYWSESLRELLPASLLEQVKKRTRLGMGQANAEEMGLSGR